MKLFQFTQKIYAMMGISSSPSVRAINGKTVITFLLYGFGAISTGLFLSQEATTFNEFTEAIYICSAFIIIGLAFACMKINSGMLFKFIGNFEKIIEMSEFTK